MLEDSVVLRDEEGLLAVVGLIGLVLGCNLLVDVGAEFLVKHSCLFWVVVDVSKEGVVVVY